MGHMHEEIHIWEDVVNEAVSGIGWNVTIGIDAYDLAPGINYSVGIDIWADENLTLSDDFTILPENDDGQFVGYVSMLWTVELMDGCYWVTVDLVDVDDGMTLAEDYMDLEVGEGDCGFGDDHDHNHSEDPYCYDTANHTVVPIYNQMDCEASDSYVWVDGHGDDHDECPFSDTDADSPCQVEACEDHESQECRDYIEDYCMYSDDPGCDHLDHHDDEAEWEDLFWLMDTDNSSTVDINEMLTAFNPDDDSDMSTIYEMLMMMHDYDNSSDLDLEEFISMMHSCLLYTSPSPRDRG